jgi:hypothetical protein
VWLTKGVLQQWHFQPTKDRFYGWLASFNHTRDRIRCTLFTGHTKSGHKTIATYFKDREGQTAMDYAEIMYGEFTPQLEHDKEAGLSCVQMNVTRKVTQEWFEKFYDNRS